MRSLFLQIFVWLWMAMLLIGLTLVAVTIATQAEPFYLRRSVLTGAMPGYAVHAVAEFERGGRTALQTYQEQVQREAHIPFTRLVDPQAPRPNPARTGQPRTGQGRRGGLFVFARELANRAALTDYTIFDEHEGWHYVAQRAMTSKGNYMVFVGMQPPINLFNIWNARPGIRLLRIVAVFMAGCLVCYWLARYLTRPVLQLRSVTQQLAAGDLKARVGGAMGRRRDELADLARDFDRMADRIETLVQSQQRLLGDISHELRSPLARMNVALALARRQSGPEAAASLDRIERESVRLNDLIGQLLNLTRLESGDAQPGRQPIELARLVEEVAADADFEARSHGRSVRVEESVACTIKGDPQLVRSALENVVRNAVHYTAENSSVTIKLYRAPESAISSQAVIEVLDRGPGVPEEVLDKLFRPFYRVEDARDRQSGGTGIGLTITQRAVESHGGSVRACNRPDGGLCVEIRLPITEPGA